MSRWMARDDKTKHQYFEDRLSSYLDGELSPQEQDAVGRHLSTCQACQWDLGTLQQTVRWTRELPQVPVPRVFTIQVPAPPAREPRRRWNFLPLLQGATALVALLLVFVVAGDFLLGGQGGMSIPRPMAVQKDMAEAPVAEMQTLAESAIVVETIEVEKEIEAPAEAKAVEVAATVLVEATKTAGGMPALEPTLGLEGEGAGEQPVADEAPRAAAPAATGTQAAAATRAVAQTQAASEPEEAAVAGSGLAPTLAPMGTLAPAPPGTLGPPQAPSGEEPNAIAEAGEMLSGAQSWQEQFLDESLRRPSLSGLRVAEYLLVAAFVILAATTLTVMILRRRRG